jgi:hypothetical protein
MLPPGSTIARIAGDQIKATCSFAAKGGNLSEGLNPGATRPLAELSEYPQLLDVRPERSA